MIKNALEKFKKRPLLWGGLGLGVVALAFFAVRRPPEEEPELLTGYPAEGFPDRTSELMEMMQMLMEHQTGDTPDPVVPVVEPVRRRRRDIDPGQPTEWIHAGGDPEPPALERIIQQTQARPRPVTPRFQAPGPIVPEQPIERPRPAVPSAVSRVITAVTRPPAQFPAARPSWLPAVPTPATIRAAARQNITIAGPHSLPTPFVNPTVAAAQARAAVPSVVVRQPAAAPRQTWLPTVPTPATIAATAAQTRRRAEMAAAARATPVVATPGFVLGR